LCTDDPKKSGGCLGGSIASVGEKQMIMNNASREAEEGDLHGSKDLDGVKGGITA